jgi:precorrin-2 dehydrogenase / sirohydrochlorin ferrochelatase
MLTASDRIRTAMSGYPIVLDVSERQIVIVGGGNVALRKAKGLLDSGAMKIRVVSPKFHADIPQQVQRVMEVYRREHLRDAKLVFAATDVAAVNEQLERDAHEIGALICRADADDAGDFSTPAMHRDGELLLTVSSGGPALSALVRDRMAERIEPRWVAMAEAMRTLRPMIREKISSANRRKVFMELCSEAAFDELERGGVDGLMKWMREKFPDMK